MEDQKHLRALRASAIVFVLMWLFVPLSLLTGVAGFGHGARALIPNALGALLGKGAMVLVGSYFFIVFPTAYLIYGEATEKVSGLTRVLFVSFLLCLPVFSYAYNAGNFRETLDYAETALSLGVGVLTQVLIFEWSGSVLVFTLGLSVTLFVPLFVVNELLGPYFVYFTYAPHNMTLYWLHRTLSVLAVAYCLWQTRSAWLRLLVPVHVQRPRNARHHE